VNARLLDVNVLIASAWPNHPAHKAAGAWLAKSVEQGWASCAFTQAAFVRILSNPAFSPNRLSVADAVALLNLNLKHPAHVFWPMDIGLSEAVGRFRGRLFGHQQVTDAYLLGLALHRGGGLATLDKSLVDLLPLGSPERERITVIAFE
jgi:toxin-antitoxin system PIN domain toxin